MNYMKQSIIKKYPFLKERRRVKGPIEKFYNENVKLVANAFNIPLHILKYSNGKNPETIDGDGG